MEQVKLESYQELKSRQGKELNDFEGIFFAFSNEQFDEGMLKVGLTTADTKEIYSLGAGGYILKTRSKAFQAMFERHTVEKKQRNKEEKFLVKSIAYELANHEYCITCDVTDALDALELERSELDKGILKKAIILHNEEYRS